MSEYYLPFLSFAFIAACRLIYDYIALNSPTYARRMVDRITRRSEQISIQAPSGRKVPDYEAEDIRELIEKPYRIIYRVKQGQIDVLAHKDNQLVSWSNNLTFIL